MAQLIKPQIKWTEDKINLLKKEYPLGDKKQLALKLGIKYKTLKSAAQTFGIKSLQDKNLYKLKPLYEDSILSWYWIGFIMADGQIDNRGQLRIGLSIKDKEHLNKIAKFLGVEIHEYKTKNQFSNNKLLEYCRLTCQDAKYGKMLLIKLGLSGLPKTYNPPNKLKFPNQKCFLSFLIGYIDGDGTFSKHNGKCSFIKIEVHASWLKILEIFKKQLLNMGIEGMRTGINSRKYAYFKLYRQKNLSMLKRFSIDNELPILQRKWDTVILK